MVPRAAAAAVVILATLGAADPGQFPGQQAPMPNPERPYLLPAVNRLPDKNDQLQMAEQQSKSSDFAAANVERRKQIADDTARLLKMASELKAEVDKTSKDTLSLNVIRKADDIEKIAHGIKEKMKLTMGAS
jgi:hypothetical protein